MKLTQKFMIRLISLFAIGVAVYYFIFQPGNENCNYINVPAASAGYINTLEALEKNTTIFFECMKSDADGKITDDEVPPCINCTTTASEYIRPGTCKTVPSDPDYCPPPRCVVSLMRCAVTKDVTSKITLENSSKRIVCVTAPIYRVTGYYRYNFNPKELSELDRTLPITITFSRRDESDIVVTGKF